MTNGSTGGNSGSGGSSVGLGSGGGPPSSSSFSINGNNNSTLKRRAPESIYEHYSSAAHDWNDYMLSSKRQHLVSDSNHLFPGRPPLFDQPSTSVAACHGEQFSSLLEKQMNHRDDRSDMRIESQRGGSISVVSAISNSANAAAAAALAATVATSANNGLVGEEEWKNIHTMLNCILNMVDKTKRAITILQQRGVETSPQYANFQLQQQQQPDVVFNEIKRQTEEKVAEFRQNAEEAVNEVKRQVVVEIQCAVVAAESRAVEVMTQERIKMEKMFAEISKNNSHNDNANQSAAVSGSQNVCWNCGRQANETCSGCYLARYCGVFCQQKNWKQHQQICGNSRIDTNGIKYSPPHFRATVSPSRTSPTCEQQSTQQSSATSINLSNGINSGGSIK